MKYGSFKYGEKKYGYGDIHFVYDRTIEDVTKETEKGFLNYTDLNRIEKNIQSAAIMCDVEFEAKTDWQVGDFIFTDDFNRLQNAIKTMYDKTNQHITNGLIYDDDFSQINYSKLNHFEKMVQAVYEGGKKL